MSRMRYDARPTAERQGSPSARASSALADTPNTAVRSREVLTPKRDRTHAPTSPTKNLSCAANRAGSRPGEEEFTPWTDHLTVAGVHQNLRRIGRAVHGDLSATIVVQHRECCAPGRRSPATEAPLPQVNFPGTQPLEPRAPDHCRRWLGGRFNP
jgi:hypothetical protein